MYLRCQTAVFLTLCLAFSTAYTSHSVKRKENNHRNKRESEMKQSDSKGVPLNLSSLAWKNFLPNMSPRNIFSFSTAYNEKAIDILKDTVASEVSNKSVAKNLNEYSKDTENQNIYNKNSTNINDFNNVNETTRENVLSVSNALALNVLNISANKSNKIYDILKDYMTTKIDNENSSRNFNSYSKDIETENSSNKSFTSITDLSETTEEHTDENISNISTVDIISVTDIDLTELTSLSFKNDEEQISLSETTEKTTDENISNISTDDIAPTTEPDLIELTSLSFNDDGEEIVGQKIDFQRSSPNTNTEETNPPGVEILKNISRVCGSLFGKRISFANETTLMEFPWTALLLYNTKIRFHCGGSLITTKYVLTAAHCVAQEFYELAGVRLGEHDVTEDPDCAPDLVGDNICATTVDVNVVKIIIHHSFSHLSFKNDIALLRLDNEYYSRSFYPICIPTPEMMYNVAMATVAGWGATEKTIRSAVLLKADVPLLHISKCRDIYRYSVFNDTTEICGSGANEVDVCKGDSGGALFHRQNIKGKDKFYQLGIISLGVRRCGDSRFLPAVFTKLNAFYKWIENNLEY